MFSAGRSIKDVIFSTGKSNGGKRKAKIENKPVNRQYLSEKTEERHVLFRVIR